MRNRHIVVILSVIAAVAAVAVVVSAGNQNTPSAPPETTSSSTLQCTYRAGVPQTGQTISYAAGDDGDLQMGVAWDPSTRFQAGSTGAVTDTLTGLVWLQNANCTTFYSGDPASTNSRNWSNALKAANSLASGYCGLSDGSSAGDWRLPNRKELESLLDMSEYSRALPAGHPFTGVMIDYWSSTTYVLDTSYAWTLGTYEGIVETSPKWWSLFVWPVRQVDTTSVLLPIIQR